MERFAENLQFQCGNNWTKETAENLGKIRNVQLIYGNLNSVQIHYLSTSSCVICRNFEPTPDNHYIELIKQKIWYLKFFHLKIVFLVSINNKTLNLVQNSFLAATQTGLKAAGGAEIRPITPFAYAPATEAIWKSFWINWMITFRWKNDRPKSVCCGSLSDFADFTQHLWVLSLFCHCKMIFKHFA